VKLVVTELIVFDICPAYPHDFAHAAGFGFELG
jgi:hypothetical protein